jgi:hypothetical protein
MMQDEERRQTAPRADSYQAADANIAERQFEERKDKTVVPVHPLTSTARPSGAGITQDETPEAVSARVEGVKERTG